jgi:cystathionine gamma-synthase
VKNEQNRGLFVQLGWIYLDTMEIIRKYAPQSHRHFDLLNSDSFEAFIKEHSADVAAVFTEIPTNPLIQTVDLPRLSAFLKSQGIPLVVDTSIGTPYTMEILPYADIVIESLTKFAGGNTDEMMGAVILNKHSGHAEAIRPMIGENAELPYEKDARRLAWEIQGYENRVRKVSENASVIIPYFLHSKKVKRLHWALDGVSGENFRKIMKSEALIPGLVSIIFDQKLQFYYDRLKIAKGPSFGSDFTLGMAYVYLAHFKMLKTEAGRKELSALGIEPEMLRLSIGTESADSIIALFEEL